MHFDGMDTQTPPELPEFVTLDQAAERLSVCRRTLEREITRGRFPKPIRIGRSVRIPVSVLREYIDKLLASGSTP